MTKPRGPNLIRQEDSGGDTLGYLTKRQATLPHAMSRPTPSPEVEAHHEDRDEIVTEPPRGLLSQAQLDGEPHKPLPRRTTRRNVKSTFASYSNVFENEGNEVGTPG